MKNFVKEGLFKSALSTRIVSLSEQVGEVAIDALLTDEFLKSLPILGPLVNLVKAGNDIQAYAFARKISSFLLELENIPMNERQDFVHKYEENEAERIKISENVFFALESAKSIDITRYLGRNFALYIKGDISEHEFHKHNHIITSLNPHIIEQITFCYRHENVASFSGDSMHFLATLGLIDLKVQPKKAGDAVVFDYHPTRNMLGKAFYRQIVEK